MRAYPALPRSVSMKTITISVTEELYRDVHVAAALRDKSVTALLRSFFQLLSDDLEQDYRVTLNRRVRAKRAQYAQELSTQLPQEKILVAKNTDPPPSPL